VARDHEYVRHGTLSLLAGIDLLTGMVHASVEERHRSREFVAFLQKLNAAYPPATAIKLILDNHSAHVSKETQARNAAPGPLRLRVHAQARFLAQSRGRLLLETRPIRASAHPRRVQTRIERANHGHHQRHQP
jgi:hypothetical protein